MLARHGVTLRGLGLDTMLASYLLDATRSEHPLEELALEHLGYKALTEEDVCGRGAKAVSLADVPAEAALDYAGERADLALQLAPTAPRPARQPRSSTAVYATLERPLIPVLVAIERAGVRDRRRRRSPRSRSTSSRSWRRAAAQIFELAGERVQHQLAASSCREILFDKLQLPALKRNGKTRRAVDGRRSARGAGARARPAAADSRVARR